MKKMQKMQQLKRTDNILGRLTDHTFRLQMLIDKIDFYYPNLKS
jgi:hypothetical protein